MNKRISELINQNRTEYEQGLSKHYNDDVLIVDALNQFIRVFGAVPTLNDDGVHIGGITGFLLSLGSTIRQFRPTRVVLVFDGKGGSTRRRAIYSNYKEGRKGITKLNRIEGFEDVEDRDVSMKRQLSRLVEYLQQLPIQLLVIDNIEADDIIAYAANHYFKNKVTIMSMDRDFLQLVNDRISLYEPRDKFTYTPDDVLKSYGVLPQNMIWYRIMMGDASDKIKGIQSIGKKTIATMDFLKENIIDSSDDFYTICKERMNEKIYKKIESQRDTFDRNYDLMQLKQPNMSSSMNSMIRNLLDDSMDFDEVEFKRMFMNDKMYTAFADVGSWLRMTFSDLNVYKTRYFENHK